MKPVPGAAVLLALALVASEARAQDVEDPPPPPKDSAGRMLGAFGLGLATTAGGTFLAVNWGVTAVSYVVGAALPIATGFTACAVMRGSPHYTGSCSWAVLGAYVGAATAVPLATLGAVFSNNDEIAGVSGLLAGAALGAVIGTPLGAVIGWNLGKERRTPPAVAFTPPLVPMRDLASGRPRLMVPVAAFTF